jgi:hypothetical protein
MNETKTEFILFGSNNLVIKCNAMELNVNGTMVQRSNSIKYLGVVLDSHLDLKQHITSKCRAAMTNLQRIKCIRPYLTEDTCHTLVRGLVISYLDYANATFINLPKCTLKKLERVQRAAARVIKGQKVRASVRSSITTMMRDLHWLPIEQRIDYKVGTIVFKSLYGNAPEYVKCLFQIKQHSKRNLRSNTSQTLQLVVPFTKRKTFADRSISVYGPKLWNSLPTEVKLAGSIENFKSKLKTYLFRMAYSQ